MEKHLWSDICQLQADMSLWQESHAKERNEMQDKLRGLERENARLRGLVSALKEQAAGKGGGKCVFLADLLNYAEHFPPEQFERAKVMKEAIRDLFPCFTPEESERIRNIGTSRASYSLTVNGPLNDIHDNNTVNATV